MERIINGKTWKEIDSGFRKEFLDDELSYSQGLDITYLDIDRVTQRMDEVLGCNYSVDYEVCQVDELPDAGGEITPFIRVKCTIRIVDDDGNEVLRRSRWGGDRVTRLTDGKRAGAIVNYGNDLDGCCSDAFKRCCRTLGIGSSKVGKGNKIGQTYEIEYKSEFTAKGTSGYSARVFVCGEEYELVVWNDNQADLVAALGENWMKCAYSGKKGKITGSIQTYKGTKQLIFSGLGKR